MIELPESPIERAVRTLRFQTVLADRINITNKRVKLEGDSAEISVELLPKIGSPGDSQAVFALLFKIDSEYVELNISVRAIYSHPAGEQYDQKEMWTFFALVAAQPLLETLKRIRDGLIPVMFAQFDFLEPLEELQDMLLEKANSLGCEETG